METFAEYLATLKEPDQRERVEEVLEWVKEEFPHLDERIAWNQPMFTDHGTYIIGFSVAKKHMAVAPEREGILHFSEAIKESGFEHTKMLVRIPWSKPVDYQLLRRMITFNIEEKKNYTSFWR
ncbi:iron chaperone [Salimicrobium halophilum]|uniref:YdhG-like domain-containing protein n=1 Tax=Salimicrobium halophilum TaxID=86666 RepID=A0A1G8QYN7_9BACI|nr:iron chaperone [Salimicrobium halophilum]SDJ09844.1 hypothetical protein SAMN04490247_0711 [Salimicrobium halophilum]